MTSQEKVSFSLKKMLALPIVFAILFWLFPGQRTIVPISIAAFALVGVVILATSKTWPRIITVALGSFAGGVVAISLGPNAQIPVAFIGAIAGYLLTRLTITAILASSEKSPTPEEEIRTGYGDKNFNFKKLAPFEDNSMGSAFNGDNVYFYTIESTRAKAAHLNKLNSLSSQLEQKFLKIWPEFANNFYLSSNDARDITARVTFVKNDDIHQFEKSGDSQKLLELIYSELESAGIGKQPDVIVQLEFDAMERFEIMERTPKPPIDHDATIARIHEEDKEQYLHLDSIKRDFKLQFGNVISLYHFEVMPQRSNEFTVFVFFELENDLLESRTNGIAKSMVDFVYAALEHYGKGKKEEIKVRFEVDSHENIIANYSDSLFSRLR